jgi:hypothetical protein
MTCPKSGWRYREVEPGVLRCLDKNGDKPIGAMRVPPAQYELMRAEVSP